MKRFVLLSVAAALLAACAVKPQVTDRVRVLNGAMVVAAPTGYCVAPSSHSESAQGAFALFGSCAAISGDASMAPAPYPVMLSATVGLKVAAPLAQSFPAFERFFHSPSGRAAIARSGLAGDVDIVAVRRQGGMMLLKIRDRSASTTTPVSTTYWRAITDLNGRIAALSVLPMKGITMSDSAQIRLLVQFDQAIRAASRNAGVAL